MGRIMGGVDGRLIVCWHTCARCRIEGAVLLDVVYRVRYMGGVEDMTGGETEHSTATQPSPAQPSRRKPEQNRMDQEY